MLNFKKPHTWVAVFVVAVIVIVAANFLTNQKTMDGKDSISDTTNTQIENAEVESTEVPVTDNAIDEKTKQSILDWAQAFAKRDGDKIVEMSTKDAQKTLENETCCRQANRMEKLFIPLDGPVPGRMLSIIPASHPTCCIPQMSKIRLLTFFIMQKFPTRM